MASTTDRLREQATDDAVQTALTNARPTETPAPCGPSASWAGRCAGSRDGVHSRRQVESDGRWRCRWCGQAFEPPAAYAHVTWVVCQTLIDLAKPIAQLRSRGRPPVFVYACPSCESRHTRLADGYIGNEPKPQTGTFVCGKQVAQRGAA